MNYWSCNIDLIISLKIIMFYKRFDIQKISFIGLCLVYFRGEKIVLLLIIFCGKF